MACGISWHEGGQRQIDFGMWRSSDARYLVYLPYSIISEQCYSDITTLVINCRFPVCCMTGDVALGGRKLREEKGHFDDDWKPAEFDTKQIFVSPSVHYAGQECYAESKGYDDNSCARFGEEFVFGSLDRS